LVFVYFDLKKKHTKVDVLYHMLTARVGVDTWSLVKRSWIWPDG